MTREERRNRLIQRIVAVVDGTPRQNTVNGQVRPKGIMRTSLGQKDKLQRGQRDFSDTKDGQASMKSIVDTKKTSLLGLYLEMSRALCVKQGGQPVLHSLEGQSIYSNRNINCPA